MRSTRYVSPTAAAIAAMAAGDLVAGQSAVARVVPERDANFALFRKMRALDPIRASDAFVFVLREMDVA